MEKRSRNLEIQGLPEEEDENCLDLVTSFLKKVTPKPLAVKQCYRSGRKIKQNGEKNTRNVVVEFKTQQDRDVAFAGRDNLKCENQTLFLNIHLPPHMKILREKANAIRKQKGYEYLWMKNGYFLVRKNEGTDVIVVNKVSDLDKII